MFRGKSIFLVGDPAQLPPVADKPLYHTKPSRPIGEQGHIAYLMFDKVVKLSANQRVQGSSTMQLAFKHLLMRLRTGDSTEQDWQLLLSHQLSLVANFDNAIKLFYGNDDVAAYNHQELLKLSQPVACIQACHSSPTAKSLPSDEMSGLVPILFLARNASVMFTMNLWREVGLCNGATGKVVDLRFAENHSPPDLPIAVTVKFDYYTGPSFTEFLPKCVPVSPVTVTSHSLDTFHKRQQLPLKLSWAITILKSQGLTLEKAWINIGPREQTAGMTYVAISEVKTLDSCVIEPMSFERLKTIKNASNFQFRLQEEERLSMLANNTTLNFIH